MAVPRDINNKIISLLDIDTRRSLNIYTRLNISEDLSLLYDFAKLKMILDEKMML